jgi:hypothetical protein
MAKPNNWVGMAVQIIDVSGAPFVDLAQEARMAFARD